MLIAQSKACYQVCTFLGRSLSSAVQSLFSSAKTLKLHPVSLHSIRQVLTMWNGLQTRWRPQSLNFQSFKTSTKTFKTRFRLCITENKSWRDLQVIQRQIIELTDIEKLHQQNFDTLTDKICCLQNEKNNQLWYVDSKFSFLFQNPNT
jgi:hypothetical protein